MYFDKWMRTGRARFVAALIAIVACSTACGDGAGPAADLGDPATLGQRTFAQWCAPCHGVEGEGNINALEAPALNASGDTYLLTDAEILDGIVTGGTQEGSGMQPLGEFLTAEQQNAVMYYVHTLWTADQRVAHEAAGGHIPPTPAPGN